MRNNEIRIMMIEPLGDGGIAHYTYNLLNALSNKCVDSILFTNKNYELKNKEVDYQVCQCMFRFASWLINKFPQLDGESGLVSFIRRIIKVIEYPFNIIEALYVMKAKRINIVHLQSVNFIEMLMIVGCRLINRKVVYTIHNVMPRHQKLKFYHVLLCRRMYAMCDQIIIHSEKGKEEIIDLYGVDEKKTKVIPHGDYKFFVPDSVLTKIEAKKRLGFDVRTKTILFFGAIRSNKGLSNILLAMPFIKDRISSVKLLIVGELWEEYEKYRKIINKNCLGNFIWEKLEYVSNEELPLYFFASDLVVLPYDEITGSGILQIAYAFSKPVVASDIAGFRESVASGKNGYLVPVNDYSSMADKIVDILEDDLKQEKMGEYSRNLSDTKYSWVTIAESTKEIYNVMLSMVSS